MEKRKIANFTPWSVVTLVIAVPVWIMVFRGSVMSRDVDGGIFLSVSDAISGGLSLYDEVWDNKDPFFFVAMSGASRLSPNLSFFMDLLWIPLASFGSWLISRSVMSKDRSLFLALVTTPFILTGPLYNAGWTNTPGTALALLAWGLFVAPHQGKWTAILSGITLGLLAFVKLTIFPVALLGVLLLLVVRSKRARVLRTSIAMLITLLISVIILVLLDWWSGYIDAIAKNRRYASDVIVYFGFDDSPAGHMSKFLEELPGATLLAGVVAIVVTIVFLIVIAISKNFRTQQNWSIWILTAIAIVGIGVILAATYVWPHHSQALYLPLILGSVLIAALIPENWPHLVFVAILITGSFVLSGWGSPSALVSHFTTLSDQYDQRTAAISEEPIDATLINSVPKSEFTFARLGTNDDRGFFGFVREGAKLACPQFHLYDFSPASAFAEQLECIQGVDVILKTTNFDVFANGMNAANVAPILDYVKANFSCLEVGERQLCSRL